MGSGQRDAESVYQQEWVVDSETQSQSISKNGQWTERRRVSLSARMGSGQRDAESVYQQEWVVDRETQSQSISKNG